VSVVIDASITLSWYFEDERTPAANAVLDQVTATGAVNSTPANQGVLQFAWAVREVPENSDTHDYAAIRGAETSHTTC
jgi:hypothetical protein